MEITFFDRLSAYFVDMVIIYIITLIIASCGLTSTTDSYNAKIKELTESYTNNLVTEEEFIDNYTSIIFENQKSNVISLGVGTAILIAYFVIFQYMNKGQTIGKKLLHLRVVDKDTKKPPTFIKFLIRELFIFNIASGILNIVFVYTLNKTGYLMGYTTITAIETIFIVISVALVLYRKDKRGLHDLMANTIVIREGR